MKRLIAVVMMLVTGVAMADPIPSIHKIRDCQAFISYLSIVAKARKYNSFPPDKINEKFLKEKLGGKNKGLYRWLHPSTNEELDMVNKLEDAAIKMVVHANRFDLNSFAEGNINECRKYADEIVTWKPINK